MRLAMSAVLVVLMLGAGPAVQAQSVSALKQHNTHAPIDVNADRIEVRDRESQAIFQGEVKVVQANLTLESARVRVFYDRGGGDKLTILRIDADGAVRLTSPSERASANYGIYDVEDRQLTLVGNVILTKGESVLKGQRLEVNLENGVTRLDGAPAGVGQRGDRVTGRFAVPARDKTP